MPGTAKKRKPDDPPRTDGQRSMDPFTNSSTQSPSTNRTVKMSRGAMHIGTTHRPPTPPSPTPQSQSHPTSVGTPSSLAPKPTSPLPPPAATDDDQEVNAMYVKVLDTAFDAIKQVHAQAAHNPAYMARMGQLLGELSRITGCSVPAEQTPLKPTTTPAPTPVARSSGGAPTYAAAAKRATRTRNSSSRAPPAPAPTRPRHTHPPPRTHPDRVLIRFTQPIVDGPHHGPVFNGGPIKYQPLRDYINNRLNDAAGSIQLRTPRVQLRISAAQRTPGGHLALIPQAPCTAKDLLAARAVLEKAAEVAFHKIFGSSEAVLDRPWAGVVLTGVPHPGWKDRKPPTSAREAQELLAHQAKRDVLDFSGVVRPEDRASIQACRLLCPADKIPSPSESFSLCILTSSPDFCSRLVQHGACAFGQQVRVAKYRPRRRTSQPQS